MFATTHITTVKIPLQPVDPNTVPYWLFWIMRYHTSINVLFLLSMMIILWMILSPYLKVPIISNRRAIMYFYMVYTIYVTSWKTWITLTTKNRSLSRSYAWVTTLGWAANKLWGRWLILLPHKLCCHRIQSSN